MRWLRMLWCMLAHDWSMQTRYEDLLPFSYCETCRGFVVDLYGKGRRG